MHPRNNQVLANGPYVCLTPVYSWLLRGHVHFPFLLLLISLFRRGTVQSQLLLPEIRTVPGSRRGKPLKL